MKKWIISVVACCVVLNLTAAEDLKWTTDLAEAQAEAEKKDRLVLIDFTGSDWCGWCIKFKKDTLSKPEFKDYAAKNLVLVEVDFPRKKEQSAELKAANKKLQDKYGVRGFPTYVILSPEGKEVGRQVGYLKGGPSAFIAVLEEAKKKS